MFGLFTASGATAGKNDFVPAMGWFGYAPIRWEFTGAGTDFWIMGLQILGVASLSASLNCRYDYQYACWHEK